MTREQRAKQFAPFDALKGLHEALREKEEKHLREERLEKSEDQQEEISRVLSNLKVGEKVEIKYFNNGHYLTESGLVENINFKNANITIKNITIDYGDIYKILLLN